MDMPRKIISHPVFGLAALITHAVARDEACPGCTELKHTMLKEQQRWVEFAEEEQQRWEALVAEECAAWRELALELRAKLDAERTKNRGRDDAHP